MSELGSARVDDDVVDVDVDVGRLGDGVGDSSRDGRWVDADRFRGLPGALPGVGVAADGGEFGKGEAGADDGDADVAGLLAQAFGQGANAVLGRAVEGAGRVDPARSSKRWLGS
jgi:hypothetical protein